MMKVNNVGLLLQMERGLPIPVALGGSCGPLSCTTTYLFISDVKSWYDAQSYCRSHYTDLVTVENQTLNDQLLQISGQREGWIGLRHGNDTWQWSDGDQLTYRNWNPTLYCASKRWSMNDMLLAFVKLVTR
uniref:C-type lectin domain-containing protein n=1 Tax=Erpetoichthys calabaricus TaxID=27687 RepID=A0A8C4T7M1_ERPCA